MANPIVNEFTLSLDGTSYRFRLGLRELIEIQERLISPAGEVPSIQAIDRGVRAGRLRYTAMLIWGGLRTHHASVTEQAVIDLMARMTEAEMASVLSAFGYSVTPDPADVQALGVSTDPPTAQDETTGAASTSMPVAVA